MTQSLTDQLQQRRLTVVQVDPSTGQLRVRGEGDVCSDLSCHQETVVVTDEGTHPGLAMLHPGDIIKLETAAGRPERIVVVRRVWEEIASPEL